MKDRQAGSVPSYLHDVQPDNPSLIIGFLKQRFEVPSLTEDLSVVSNAAIEIIGIPRDHLLDQAKEIDEQQAEDHPDSLSAFFEERKAAACSEHQDEKRAHRHALRELAVRMTGMKIRNELERKGYSETMINHRIKAGTDIVKALY